MQKLFPNSISTVKFLKNTSIIQYQSRQYAEKKKYKFSPKILILMGPPGAGKGTQARFLKDFSIVGAGDTLREESQHNQELKEQLKRGELASEQQIAELLAKKISNIVKDAEKKNEDAEKKIEDEKSLEDNKQEKDVVSLTDIVHPGIVKTQNIIIEGYPRNEAQCVKLMDWFPEASTETTDISFAMKNTLVVHLMCDKDAIKKRLKGRLIHNQSGRTYHVDYRPPKVEKIDDVTGEPLTQRDDDLSSEAIQKRLETYRNHTLPVIEKLSEEGFRVVDINSAGSIESVHQRLVEELKTALKTSTTTSANQDKDKAVESVQQPVLENVTVNA
ncbi:adenylate kinase [Acrasis kona]|uniref:Adenylate kinase n=1 Tax=Acrasis kona TaxID=1008807 RepID=A0AAW2ZNH3_9EUKA